MNCFKSDRTDMREQLVVHATQHVACCAPCFAEGKAHHHHHVHRYARISETCTISLHNMQSTNQQPTRIAATQGTAGSSFLRFALGRLRSLRPVRRTQHVARVKLGLLLLLMAGKAQSLTPLPAGLTELGTVDGQQMLRNSTPSDRFWQLAQEFVTQDSQDWCGLASASMVLNALPIPKPALHAFQGWVSLASSQNLHFLSNCAAIYQLPSLFMLTITLTMCTCRYPYFYQDNILKTSVPQVMTARQVAESGLGLDDITEILNAHVGVTAEALHTDPTRTSLDQFRQSIADAMSQPDTYLIANFDRYEFMGEGGGHHSPLGAFCAASDTVLVLDVARYRLVTLTLTQCKSGSCMHQQAACQKHNQDVGRHCRGIQRIPYCWQKSFLGAKWHLAK